MVVIFSLNNGNRDIRFKIKNKISALAFATRSLMTLYKDTPISRSDRSFLFVIFFDWFAFR